MTRPTTDDIRTALERYAPKLAGEPIEFLGEGWSVWAFRAGDYVLRFPMHKRDWDEFEKNRRLLPALAAHLSWPVPVPVISGEQGPNDAPFEGNRFIPGVSLITAAQFLPASARGGNPSIVPALTFGRDLGRFLRELHSFPVEQALALGMRLNDGPAWRKRRGAFYEEVIKGVFPLISCEARSFTESRFEAYLNDPANFDFDPRVIHSDLDRQNVLIDPESGVFTGVIDYGGLMLCNPAIDLWLPLVDFEKLGIARQLPDFLDAYGTTIDIERARIEAEFVEFLWPYHDMLFGQHTGDQDLIEGGIRALNAVLPRDVVCP